jgi:succinate dehydrogenase/fumarate reductase flavoprotein subunit
MVVEKVAFTPDVIVVGSGAAGLTAAIVAARAGLGVLVVEKTRYFGGTTAVSGGGLWIPCNPYMAGLGLTDSTTRAEQYLRGLLGDLYDARKIGAFLENGPEMVRYMGANTEVAFTGAATSDYEPWQEGAATGRTLFTPSYDARRLGKDFDHLRPALDQLGAFGGMQIGFEDASLFVNVLHSPKALVYSAGKFLRYVRDRVGYGRATRVVNGNSLAARLLLSARKCGVTLWHGTAVTDLLVEDGVVRGVTVTRDGQTMTVRAGRAVILASGGYGANPAMRRENIPMADDGWSLQPEGNVGDGIRLGERYGGMFIRENIANGIWAPMSSMLQQDGTRVNFSHIMLDRHYPGFLVVDRNARRFVNEAASYQAFGDAMHEQGIASAWLIGTHEAVRRHSMGLAKPAPLPIGRYLANGYLKKAASIAELAQKIGVDPKALETTVETFNRYADAGQDPDFHRGEDAYSIGQSDPTHTPNPSLGALREGPFYAIELHPGELSTTNGLETNEHAQVLGKDGSVVEGLYAVGVDANSVFRGAYPGGGASLGPGMTFGYIAARHIAASVRPVNQAATDTHHQPSFRSTS